MTCRMLIADAFAGSPVACLELRNSRGMPQRWSGASLTQAGLSQTSPELWSLGAVNSSHLQGLGQGRDKPLLQARTPWRTVEPLDPGAH